MDSEQFETLRKKTLEYRKNYGEEWEIRKSRKKEILVSMVKGDEETLIKILDETKPFSNYDKQAFDKVEFTEYNQEVIQTVFDSVCSKQAGPIEEENNINLVMLFSGFSNGVSNEFHIKVNKHILYGSTRCSEDFLDKIKNEIENIYLIKEDKGNRAKLGKIGLTCVCGLGQNTVEEALCLINFE